MIIIYTRGKFESTIVQDTYDTRKYKRYPLVVIFSGTSLSLRSVCSIKLIKMWNRCDVVFRDVEFGRGISAQHEDSKDRMSLQKREQDYLGNSWWQGTDGSCLQKQLLSRQIHNTILNSVRHVLNNKIASFRVKNRGGGEKNVLGKPWSREQRDVGKLFAPRSPCCT